MASIISHGVVGAALGALYASGQDKPIPKRFWVLSAGLAMLPDADAIGFALGIPYESFFGHRGFTHSLVFALVASLCTVRFAFRAHRLLSASGLGLAAHFFLVLASHPVLDAMTTGGLGVALLSPFNTERIFFPWRPIRVSPIGIKAFFSTWGLRVIASEALWVWLPSILLFQFAWIQRLRHRLRAAEQKQAQAE